MQKHNEVRQDETSKREAETTLDRVLLKVAEDASKKPEAYLDETIVPEGGE